MAGNPRPEHQVHACPRSTLAAGTPRRRAGAAGAKRSRRRSAAPQNSGMNAYGLRPLAGQQWWQRTRRHQRWTTRHPIRFQECADRRPLLQQSCSDLRFPGPPADHPMRRPRCPRVHGNRSHGCHGPRCRLPQLRPQPIPSITNDHQKLTLLDGRRMVAGLEPRSSSAPSPIPAQWAPRRISPDQTRTTRDHDPPIHECQPGRPAVTGRAPFRRSPILHGSGFFMAQIRRGLPGAP